MSLILNLLCPLFYLLGAIYVLFGVYLHSGPQEFIFTDLISREELYIALGGGFTLLGIIAEVLAVGVYKNSND
jgi:hypothetical protein